MTEIATVYQSFGAGIGLVVASLLYSLGGRSGKWKRRFIASFILTTTVISLCLIRGCFSYWHLLIYPILALGFSLGYGADDILLKVFKRFYCALAVLMAGLVMAFTLNGWGVFIPHAGIAMWSVWMGVKNPIPAASEEFFICMMLNLGLVMYPFLPVL